MDLFSSLITRDRQWNRISLESLLAELRSAQVYDAERRLEVAQEEVSILLSSTKVESSSYRNSHLQVAILVYYNR